MTPLPALPLMTALLLALPATTLAATAYKLVGADGRISYSDVPPAVPPGARVELLRLPETAASIDPGATARLDAMRETTARMRRDRLEREAARALPAPLPEAPAVPPAEAEPDAGFLPGFYGHPRRPWRPRWYGERPPAAVDGLDPSRSASPRGLEQRLRQMR